MSFMRRFKFLSAKFFDIKDVENIDDVQVFPSLADETDLAVRFTKRDGTTLERVFSGMYGDLLEALDVLDRELVAS